MYVSEDGNDAGNSFLEHGMAFTWDAGGKESEAFLRLIHALGRAVHETVVQVPWNVQAKAFECFCV